MRIIWGKIMPGQWDAFEAAFQKALEIRGQVKGLKAQWLLRDQNDPDGGMPFRNGKARRICGRSGRARSAEKRWRSCSRSLSINSRSPTARFRSRRPI